MVWLDEMTATRALINMSSLPAQDKMRSRDVSEDKSSEKNKKDKQEDQKFKVMLGYIRMNLRPAQSWLKKKRNESQSKGCLVGVSDRPDAEKGPVSCL